MKSLIKYFIIGFKEIFSNRIFTISVLLINLFLISEVVYKAINNKNELNDYETLKNQILEKIETKLVIEESTSNINEAHGAVKITNCLKESIPKDELSDNLLNISKQIEDTMNSSNLNFAFKYKDLYTGFSLSYNANQPIFAASTIKAPEAIYIYEEAEKENTNLDESLTYTSNYYNDGTGILKNTAFNKDYTIRQLVAYSIIYSDNAAHLMLNNKYKLQNIMKYWQDKGTNYIYKDNSPWGNLNAHDATIYMEELYNYYLTNTNNSNELINYFKSAWKVISAPNNIVIANKSGWSDNSLHDAAIVFDDNPYILVILSSRGYTEYTSYFNKISNLVYDFHHTYWEEKINKCTNISE